MRKYSIIEADLKSQRQEILSILKRNLPDYFEERFRWAYEGSPYGNACCFLAMEETTGKFVGSTVLLPRRFYINGRPAKVAICADYAVDKEHRAFGPALKLQRTAQESVALKGFDFIYGIPNEVSRAVFLKIGFKNIHRYQRHMKVLRAEYRNGKFIPPARLTRIAPFIVDIGLKVLSREFISRGRRGQVFETPARFDERFDALWDKVHRDYGLIGERTSSFLNWRYLECPHHDYKIFCSAGAGGELAGYIVYHVEDNMCHIADILHLSSGGVAEILFSEFIRFMRKNGTGSISIGGVPHESPAGLMQKFQFFQVNKNDNTSLLFYPGTVSADAARLIEENKLYFLDGDIDI